MDALSSRELATTVHPSRQLLSRRHTSATGEGKTRRIPCTSRCQHRNVRPRGASAAQ